MKYYIYISDAKVDMLFPQVPHDIKKKVATEIGIDIKLLTAKRKVESETEENRISRLETVLSFIREYSNVGSVDEPDEYFGGSMPLRFLYPVEVWSGIYLSGHTEKTMLGLSGSLKHMLGFGFPIPNDAMLPSNAVWILHWLKKLDVTKTSLEELFNPRLNLPANESTKPPSNLDLKLVAGLESLRDDLGFSIYENVDFVAKRLSFQRATPRALGFQDEDHAPFHQILLGSPLYLAKAD